MEEFNINILNLLSVLFAAWAGGVLAKRVGFPAILGELIIGIILGPGILGLLDYTKTVKVLAEVGIILLMVYIGIEIDFRDLKKASWPGLMAALGGFIVPFVLGYVTVLWYGGSKMAALFVAIAVGVTSLATKSRILVDLKLLNTRIAYVLMAGALISDTLALVIFAGIISFAGSGVFNATELMIVGGKAIAFFALTISIGIFILPKIGAWLSRNKKINSTFYFTVILIVAFGYSELAELAGMHNILGAFMAGLFIKDNLFPKNVSREVYKTFYDVSIGFMAPIFFVSAGFFVDINVFQTDLSLLVVIILLAVIGKILGTALFYLPTGHSWREGITIGAGMNGRGAVEIIIAGVGLEMGIIDRNIFSILVFMAIFTTMTVPVLLKWTSNWLRRRGELVYFGKREGYLILGVNPVSLIMADQLKKSSELLLIDTNRNSVNHARDLGFNCMHGNALKEDVLFEAKAENKLSFIGVTPNSEVNMLAAQLARESFFIPNTYIAIGENEEGAGIDSLQSIKAQSLFATRTNLEIWIGKILDKNYSLDKALVKETTNSRSWYKSQKKKGHDLLPLLVEGTDGIVRPYIYGDELKEGEKVIFLN